MNTRIKFFIVFVLLLCVGLTVNAQDTGGAAAQPTPVATADGLPMHMDIPGEDDGTCRHLNQDDVDNGGFLTHWGGADGSYSHVRLSFTALTHPVAHDFIVQDKDVHGSNVPGSARIVFAGQLVEFGQYGGHVHAYVFCRPDQLLEFLLEFFRPFEREHITAIIVSLGLRPEDYLDRPGVLVVEDQLSEVPATPSAEAQEELEEAEAALSEMIIGKVD